MGKTVFIDSDFRCHVTNDGTMTPIEHDFFNDKCDTFIEGYRFVPDGETWTRSDGEEFSGEMFAPAVNYETLRIAQAQYEVDIKNEALAVLGVTV